MIHPAINFTVLNECVNTGYQSLVYINFFP